MKLNSSDFLSPLVAGCSIPKEHAASEIWCRRRDSNSQSFRHYHLKIACLPISPRRRFFCPDGMRKPPGLVAFQTIREFTLKCVFSLPDTSNLLLTLQESVQHPTQRQPEQAPLQLLPTHCQPEFAHLMLPMQVPQRAQPARRAPAGCRRRCVHG